MERIIEEIGGAFLFLFLGRVLLGRAIQILDVFTGF